MTAVTSLTSQFLPQTPVSLAHYKAISSHLTASETDDELPLINLKQSFVPGEARDSKAPAKPIHLIARRSATATLAPEHYKRAPQPQLLLIRGRTGNCLLNRLLAIQS